MESATVFESFLAENIKNLWSPLIRFELFSSLVHYPSMQKFKTWHRPEESDNLISTLLETMTTHIL